MQKHNKEDSGSLYAGNKIIGWLDDAGVTDVYKLKGKPVECVFEGVNLKSWRILKEVL